MSTKAEELKTKVEELKDLVKVDSKTSADTTSHDSGNPGALAKVLDVSGGAAPTPPKYERDEDGMYWNRYVPKIDDYIRTELTNFGATIKEVVFHDNGEARSQFFDIEVTHGGKTSRHSVSEDDLFTGRWFRRLASTAAVTPRLADHALVAIKTLSTNPIERTTYTHTGWRKVGDKWVFLHSGGGIDEHGARDDIECSLPASLAAVNLTLPENKKQLVASVRASLDLINLGNPNVTLPPLAGAYRAVLGGCDFSIHLVGPTGKFKSELAARIMQHEGVGFTRLNLPANWSSTANSLEGLLFIAKDLVIVIDEYVPSGTPIERQKMQSSAERIFRAVGNSSGRGRLQQDMTQRPSKPPRGMVLSTGEAIARGESLRARVFIIEVADGDITPEKLTPAQTLGAAGAYCRAMSGYLQWLAGRLDAILKTKDAKLAEYLSRLKLSGHPRTSEIVCEFLWGFATFLKFAREVGAVSKERERALLVQCWSVLCEAEIGQREHQKNQNVVQRFIQLLGSAISSGGAFVAYWNGGPPHDAEAWGWRERTAGSGYEPRGVKVGWMGKDRKDLYLDPHAACRVVDTGGGGLSIDASSLNGLLRDTDYLLTTDVKVKSRRKITVRQNVGKRRTEVLHMAAQTFGYDKTETNPGERPPRKSDLRELNRDAAASSITRQMEELLDAQAKETK